MSDVQTGHLIVAARLSRQERESRVVVGDEVGTVPSQASGSIKPRTMSLAFALGVLPDLREARLVRGSVRVSPTSEPCTT